jgi:hypothetical protein
MSDPECVDAACTKTEYRATSISVDTWSGTTPGGKSYQAVPIDKTANSYKAWVYVFRSSVELADEDDCAKPCHCAPTKGQEGKWEPFGGGRTSTVNLDDRLPDWPTLSISGTYVLQKRDSPGKCAGPARHVRSVSAKAVRMRVSDKTTILSALRKVSGARARRVKGRG